MKNRMVFKVIVLPLVCIMLMGGSFDAMAQNRPEYVPDEVLVKFREGTGREDEGRIIGQAGGRLKHKFRHIPMNRLKVAYGSVMSTVDFLKGLPEVEYAEPNYMRYIDSVPNDPFFNQMWGLDNTGQTGGTPDADIDAPEAWDLATGNPAMVVAVIDSGMDRTHEDLAANLWTNPGEIPGNGIDDDGNGLVDDVNGWDFIRGDNDPDEEAVCGGHGTHTSGTIGAAGNNGKGVIGINRQVKLMPIKVFGVYSSIGCSASSADIINAIEYAALMNVRVSNNSYGGGPYSQAEYEAIRSSKSIFVAAAGNSGKNNDTSPAYPANYNLSNVISVAATDHNDLKAGFSNYGSSSVDLAAPGVNILSTSPGNVYSSKSGTSMATPHVAGAVALLMGHDSGLTNNEAKWKILKGTDFKSLPVLTGGRLNINNSLRLPAPEVSVLVTPQGPTTIVRGNPITIRVSLTNSAGVSKTVSASLSAVFPDGTESLIEQQTVTVPAGTTVSADITRSVPSNLATGEYQLAGRSEISSTSYDEDIVNYTVLP